MLVVMNFYKLQPQPGCMIVACLLLSSHEASSDSTLPIAK
jgi:hypothetical protein